MCVRPERCYHHILNTTGCNFAKLSALKTPENENKRSIFVGQNVSKFNVIVGRIVCRTLYFRRHQLVLLGVLNDIFVAGLAGLVPAHLATIIKSSLVHARLICRCCALVGAI